MRNKTVRTEMNDKCAMNLQAVQDTFDVLDGKWKLRILSALIKEPRHFMSLQRHVNGIGAKMLSRELKELEINDLIKRTVCDTSPVTVEYELTDYGKTLRNLIEEMIRWGLQHKQHLFSVKKQLTETIN